jgi:hypothetical protein
MKHRWMMRNERIGRNDGSPNAAICWKGVRRQYLGIGPDTVSGAEARCS